MGKKTGIDYSKITVADIPNLSDHHKNRYDVWAKGREAKKQIRKENSHGFGDCLAESCMLYSHGK